MKKVLISVAVALTLATVGCSDDAGDDSGELGGKVTGAEGTLGESTITTWAEMDENGQVSHVGFTAGAAGIDKLAEDAHLALEWPEEVQTQTFFNHLGLDFLKEGHPPAPYLHAHFDIHFYGIDKATVDAIDCANEPLPEGLQEGVPAADNDVVPDFYMIPSAAIDDGTPSGGTCVPKMGVHALDVRSPELQETDPSPFDATLILGYHAGALSFIEPMVTQAHFGTRANWGWDIPRPKKLGRSVLWPARLEANYDADSDTYDVVFSEFSPIE